VDGGTCDDRESVPNGQESGHLHPCVVEAGASRDVGVMAGAEGRDGLPVLTGAEPSALERGHHARPHGVRDLASSGCISSGAARSLAFKPPKVEVMRWSDAGEIKIKGYEVS
jgi:hypothetical protein